VKSILLMIFLGILWGGQFTLMAIALEQFSYLQVSTIRALTGSATLAILAVLLKLRSEGGINWPLYMSIALVDATLPFLLSAWGLERIASSLGSILLGSIPFLTLIVAPFILASNRLNRMAVLSVFVGFTGLLILFGPQLVSADLGSLGGFIAVLCAAFCFAIGMLLINRFCTEPPIIVARNILLCGGIQLSVLSLLNGDINTAVLTVSGQSILAAILLGVVATGFAYYLFMYLILTEGATFASMSNYLVPVVGMILGVFILDEAARPEMFISLLFVLAAIGLKQKADKG